MRWSRRRVLTRTAAFAQFGLVVWSLEALHLHAARAQTERLFNRFGQALTTVASAAKSIDTHIDVVAVGLVQGRRGFEIGLVTVDPSSQQPLFDELAKEVRMGAFPGTHHGTPHRHSVTLQVPEDVVHNLLDGARATRPHSGQWGLPTRAQSRRR